MTRPFKLFISVGEESADLHTSKVCHELKTRLPEIEMKGFGGEKMRAAGVEILFNLPELALIGFVEVIKHLPQMFKLKNMAVESWQQDKPDAILLVDYPGFHLRLAKVAHDMGIPVLYFISPQVWAWKESRVETMRQVIDALYVIFPFEEPYFARHDIEARYVGHPLIERITPIPATDETTQNKLGKPVIGLMPGSRRNELRYMLPTMLKTAEQLHSNHPDWRFLFPLADTLPDSVLNEFDIPDFIEICRDQNYQRRRDMTLAWTASGTATVENALLGIPMAVVYKTGFVNMFLGRRLVRIQYIGMVNLIAQKGICPEFIQEQFHPGNLVKWTEEVINTPERYKEFLKDLEQLRGKMGNEHTSINTAEAIITFLNNRQTSNQA